MTLVIKAGLILDGKAPRPLGPGSVVVSDGTIVAVRAPDAGGLALEGDAEVLEAVGMTLMPGMLDSHVHTLYDVNRTLPDQTMPHLDSKVLLTGVQNAALILAAGVTTVRDLGGKNGLIFALRKAIQEGVIVGPRILASGEVVTTKGGHCWYFGIEAETIDEVREAVRHQASLGADLIKVIASGGRATPASNVGSVQYPEHILTAVVEEARDRGLRVAAHASSTESIRRAVNAGVDSVEHCAWYGPDGRSFEYDPRLVEAMASRRVYVNHATLPHPFLLRAELQMTAEGKRWVQRTKLRLQSLRQMKEAGVQIILSTDAMFGLWPDGTDLARSAELLVRLGDFSPSEVLPMLTSTSAKALGIDTLLGTVEVGKWADLILVEGNPLEDITALQRVRVVVRGGKVVARSGQLSHSPKASLDDAVSNLWIEDREVCA